MFQRYTTETKRAIYFAAQRALYEGATNIASLHLLLGLVTDHDSRANTVFGIRQILPEETAKQAALDGHNAGNKCDLDLKTISPEPLFRIPKETSNTVKMSPEGKRILACTAREANMLRDYWIDTEHLVLGILREESNEAAVKLRRSGLEINTGRQRVMETKDSRPSRPNPVFWWPGDWRRPFGLIALVLFALGIISALLFMSRMRGQ
jgi:ATP-dependent Clp protease ATP-binding subunit ClpA